MNEGKIYHLSPLSKPKQRVNFKTWQFVKKNFFTGRKYFCCKSVCTEENSLWLHEEVDIKVFTETFKNEKHWDSLSSKLNEKEENLSKRK